MENYLRNNITDNGYFSARDSVENRTRQLVFSHVHSSVHKTEDGRYFACVDFIEALDYILFTGF